MMQHKPIPNNPLIEIVLTISQAENLIDLLKRNIDGLEQYIYTPMSQRQETQIDYAIGLKTSYQSVLKKLLDGYDDISPEKEIKEKDLTDAYVYSFKPFYLDGAGSEWYNFGGFKMNKLILYQKNDKFVLTRTKQDIFLDAEEFLRNLETSREQLAETKKQLEEFERDIIQMEKLEPIARKLRDKEVEDGKLQRKLLHDKLQKKDS